MDNNNETPCGLPQPKPVRLFEPVNISTDWQQVRIHAAIAAMQAQLSNDGTVKAINDLSQEFENDKDVYLQIVVASSVRLADALINELQKKGEQQ